MNTGTPTACSNHQCWFGDDDGANPNSSITSYTVQGGESLKSLAAQIGSPDLWYLIADANGLTGNEKLTAGARLPSSNSANNAFQTPRLTLSTKVTLSAASCKLTTPPPEEDECAKIGRHVIVVVALVYWRLP